METPELNHFDVILIGSGTSAYYCATPLLEAGKKVAIIDSRPFGGTCALRGCQPKKYFVANAEAVAMGRQLVGKGIEAAPRTDWKALQALKGEFLEGRSEEEVEDWREAGATPIRGEARMVAEDAIEVDGRRLTAETIVLATGGTPVQLDIPGSEHVGVSDDFLDLPDLPERILFVGGGYISCEFAFVAAHAGAKVTILQRSDRILKNFDGEMVGVLLEAAKELGIEIRTEEEVRAVEKVGEALKVTTSTGAVLETDAVFEAAGRAPNLSVLDGHDGGVETNRSGVVVDEFMRSVSNPRVFAIGDCAASGMDLAAVADEHGKAVAKSLLGDELVRPRLEVVPSATFTIPSLASVGLGEDEAREKGLAFQVHKNLSISWASSKRIGENHAGYKVLVSEEDGSILGAHLARHDAAEVINVFALAIKHGIKADDLASFPWAYPTMSSDVKNMVG
ncbi:dihydrolipoyl dehydrogenase family protein [Haloferula rosea]|uniref:NAD(P)/FAD-dependent oxidoreductase n=1 Tax=Haloferula rosea TaxID=490093 RepID=A0A934VC41_9BACT|nr:NAD(P)/FAD-dependent oxidoreductase [Haloferula rosea]MBK1828048.1 NAD(P)/FAD-dependent oxidoreductase [Haloferula rosea]